MIDIACKEIFIKKNQTYCIWFVQLYNHLMKFLCETYVRNLFNICRLIKIITAILYLK